MSDAPILHATTLAWRRDGVWCGAMLQGPSGVGKSDLALRAMAAGWRLVADDRTLVWSSGGRLFSRAPARLAGLVEARGLGVASRPALAFVELRLVVDCVDDPAALARVPDPETAQVLQVDLPNVRLYAREASAVAKLELALDTAGLALTASRRSVSNDIPAPDRALREDA